MKKPSPGGARLWTARSVPDSIAVVWRSERLKMTSEEYVTLLYQRLLDRKPDPVGLQHHAALLDETGDLRLIFDKLVTCAEYRDKHAEIDLTPWRKIGSAMGRPFVIVDVGAQRLEIEDHVYTPILEAGLDWKCIGFEPQDDRRLDRIEAEPDARLIMLDAFVGDGECHTFRMVTDSGSSSLLKLNEDFNGAYEHISELRAVSEEEVETRRLDDMLSSETIIDFLKFDIQGFELRALSGAPETLSRTHVIHIEAFFAPMYEGQGFFSDIDALLRAKGFEFVDFSTLARYRYVSVPLPSNRGERLIWADAVYFRALDPRRDPPSSFVAQAAAASLICHKHGLAQHILERGGLLHLLG
jgi:FkbM family methyltransferase